jgi:hypothetical protein
MRDELFSEGWGMRVSYAGCGIIWPNSVAVTRTTGTVHQHNVYTVHNPCPTIKLIMGHYGWSLAVSGAWERRRLAMTETVITRIALPSDLLLDALENASPGLMTRLARSEPVVLVIGGAGKGDRLAGVVRCAMAERGPGRPRALTDDDVLRAHNLVGTGMSIRDTADELGVSKSALGRALQGYGAGRGPKRKLADAETAQVLHRLAAQESAKAIAADLRVSEGRGKHAVWLRRTAPVTEAGPSNGILFLNGSAVPG